MSGWQVTAASGDAVVSFGVEASSERTATIRAMQRLSWFPEPWHLAEFELRELTRPAERVRVITPM